MVGRHGHDVGLRSRQNNRQQVFGRVIRHLLEHEGAKGNRAVEAYAQGVAVRRGLGYGVHADGAAGTGLVFHHQGLAPAGFERLSHAAHNHIQRAAGRRRHDHPYRFVRPALGGHRQRAQSAQAQRGDDDLEGLESWAFGCMEIHVVSPGMKS